MNNREVLIVDLDHTLIRTDLLHEQLLMALKKNILNLFPIILCLLKGKIALKQFLARKAPIDPTLLPYNELVLNLINKNNSSGKSTLLISASLDSEVKKVADHLKVFTDAFGTTDINLKGQNKLKYVQQTLGLKEWGYVGDSFADIPLWKESQTAVLVNTSSRLQKALRSHVNSSLNIVRLEDKKSFWASALKGLRVHQWIKNILVFTPVLLSHKFSDIPSLLYTSIAFILFSFNASSIYVLNDLLDLNADRAHPKKGLRPWARGDLSIPFGLFCFTLFSFFSLSLSFMLEPKAGWLLLTYFVLNILYTFKLKSLLLIDVILLAMMYNLRIIFGGLMTNIPISSWLLTFSVFFFLGLAFVKRFAELKKHSQSSKHNSRAYLPEDQWMIAIIGVASSLLSVLVFALYLNSPVVQGLYRNNGYLWLITPALLYWVCRTWVLTYRGALDDDPIAFAVKDRATYLVGFFILGILLFSI